ncbi:hypothetical protein [Novispirillum itersonii]|uniref:hypothetical protein n=1 Tax=Novispirillum itersonii TaxID=189 RepID=UPI001607DCFB|nr:hypothetical protein [Novispirillum itersonii]
MLDECRQSVAVGDLYETEGRRRTTWVVQSVVDAPHQGTLVRLVQVDGLGKVTIPISDLGYAGGFTRLGDPANEG